MLDWGEAQIGCHQSLAVGAVHRLGDADDGKVRLVHLMTRTVQGKADEGRKLILLHGANPTDWSVGRR